MGGVRCYSSQYRVQETVVTFGVSHSKIILGFHVLINAIK